MLQPQLAQHSLGRSDELTGSLHRLRGAHGKWIWLALTSAVAPVSRNATRTAQPVVA